MWKVLSALIDLRLICRCDQCGACLPMLRSESVSIQTFRWTCSPECYSKLIDQAIGSASPAIEYANGTDWDDTLELLNNAGSGPTLRMQMNDAIEKFQDGFDSTTL